MISLGVKFEEISGRTLVTRLAETLSAKLFQPNYKSELEISSPSVSLQFKDPPGFWLANQPSGASTPLDEPFYSISIMNVSGDGSDPCKVTNPNKKV